MTLFSAVLVAVITYWLSKRQEHQREIRNNKAKLYAKFLAVNVEYIYAPKSIDLDKRYTSTVDELCIYASPTVIHQIALNHKTNYQDTIAYANLVNEMRKDVGDTETISVDDISIAMELDVIKKRTQTS